MKQPVSAPPARRFGLPMIVVAILMASIVGGGFYALRSTEPPYFEEEQQPPLGEQPIEYTKWEKPLVALIMTGQMHGYINPCGCSVPQYGGLERRYNFIDSLKIKGWDVVGIDMGELAQNNGIPAQNTLKYELSMKALSSMGYRAVGIGAHEIKLPLGPALAQVWDKNRPMPRPIAMSLAEAAPGKMYDGLNVKPYEIIDLGKKVPKIGVLSMMGPEMREKFKNEEKFLNNSEELPKTLKIFADQGVQINVVLHHEYPTLPKDFKGIEAMEILDKRKEKAAALVEFCEQERKKNLRIPPVHLMMVLSEVADTPSVMFKVKEGAPAWGIEMGHKGTYIGLLGIYSAKDKLKHTVPAGDGKHVYRFQIVKMGPEWATPEKFKPTHPIVKHAEDYQLQVKQANLLDKAQRVPHYNQVQAQNQPGLKARFVGSDRCADCHDHAFKVLEKSAHGHATKTLEEVKNPGNRHFDPECMKCHTTGFKHPGGYNDPISDLAAWPKNQEAPDAKKLARHNKLMRNVGCESCHGPGSEHEKMPNNQKIRELINPYRPSEEEHNLEKQLAGNPQNMQLKQQFESLRNHRLNIMGRVLCISCHDEENDAHWNKPGHEVLDKWIGKGIIHRTPNPNAVPPAAKDGKAIEPPPIVIEVPK